MMSIVSSLVVTTWLMAGQAALTDTDPDHLQARADYMRYCAACHGEAAHGQGPVASWLIREPGDLTTLSQRNEGVYPADRVAWIIDGRADVAAHGTREMPVWGERFADTSRDRRAGDPDAERRIKALVAYLKSIQQ